MSFDKNPHILNASSNLIGICFILITGLHLTEKNLTTLADEISIIAAFFFLISTVLSYISIRTNGKSSNRYETLADYCFLFSLIILFSAVVIFALNIL